jgi:hypothetical protein
MGIIGEQYVECMWKEANPSRGDGMGRGVTYSFWCISGGTQLGDNKLHGGRV